MSISDTFAASKQPSSGTIWLSSIGTKPAFADAAPFQVSDRADQNLLCRAMAFRT